MLDVALGCIARGWHVFPCKPRTKQPATQNGFKDATLDEAKVRAWWTRWPDANVAIATGPSGLTVLDVDEGLAEVDFAAFMVRLGVSTYAVRTGRRPGFGVQVYFAGGGLRSIPWSDGSLKGDVRSATGYVMAEGCTHPSGAFYERLLGAATALAAVPEYVRMLKSAAREAAAADDGPITEHRNTTLVSILGRFRNGGADDEEIETKAQKINHTRMQPPLGTEELERIVANVCRYPAGQPQPQAVIGRPEPELQESEEPKDWRTLFHTREELDNEPDPEFLVRDFLQAESVTGLIGPARARKSIVTLNVIHALLTGEPLFGRFEVANQPMRVVYLCPESGKKSLGRRIRNMGLAPYVGESLFYTSMNSDPVALEDPALREAVRGSVLFIDTAIRFFKGDENSSEHMKRFGDQCHELIRHGVLAIVLLHHTAKNAEGITLESGRGSGDFGGFLTCCWGTTLDDYEDAYNSQSRMSCLKQRDFQADSFKLAPSGDQDNFFLQYVEGSENARVQVGAKAKAGKAQALAFIRAHPGLTGEAARAGLAEQGVSYSITAVRNMLREVRTAEAIRTTAA